MNETETNSFAHIGNPGDIPENPTHLELCNPFD